MENPISNQILQTLVSMQNELKSVNQRLDSIELKIHSMDSDIKELKQGQIKTNQTLEAIELKVDIVYDQTANLTEFRTLTQNKIEALYTITTQNSLDITHLRAHTLGLNNKE